MTPIEFESHKSILNKLMGAKTNPIFWQFPYLEFSTQINRLLRKDDNKVAIIVADQNQAKMVSALLKDLKPIVLNSNANKTVLLKASTAKVVIALKSYGPILSLYFPSLVYFNPGNETWRDRRWPYFMWDHAGITAGIAINVNVYVYSTVLDASSWQKYCDSKNKSHYYVVDQYQRNKEGFKISIIERNSGQKKLIDAIFDIRVQKLIKQNHSLGKKTLIYVTRKGLYPVLTCQDCRQTTYTKAFAKQLQRYQIASTINDWVDPTTAEEWADRCPNCGSWRLHPVAISLDQTYQALLELLGPEASIGQIDTVTQTRGDSHKIIKAFENQPYPTILLTTKRGVYNLASNVEDTVVVSLDAALSTSSLSVETEMLRLLFFLEEQTTNNLIIQTRLEDNQVLNTFNTGMVRKFANNQLIERDDLQFPPNFIQIKFKLPQRQTLPHEEMLRSLVTSENISGSWNNLPGLVNERVVIITIDIKHWQGPQSDSLKNYLFNMSTKIAAIINPEILL